MRNFGKRFGGLKVRVKLILLHNIFFLVLGGAVYFSLIPIFEQRIAGARAREAQLITRLFSEDQPMPDLPGLQIYEYREGTPGALQIPEDIRAWLEANPGRVYGNAERDPFIYRTFDTEHYRRLRVPHEYYSRAIRLSRWILFLSLGIVYILAVLALEAFIMPTYVYRPLRLMLNADSATRRGDRANELIPPEFILSDEIGQIMSSRNDTIRELRGHEADLVGKNELLETAKRNLADQDRLASLGLISASVAHEINTPLSVLQGSIEKLIESNHDAQAAERLQRIQRVATRLRNICDSLLDFSRVRTTQPENVQLRWITDEAWGLVAFDDRAAHVDFRNNVTESTIVRGNPDRLVQVFVNLLRNALYAVQAGGSVVVESMEGAGWITVSVLDDGPGIPVDVLPDIFEAFVTSRLDARGTGLGLTVAEGIVHQHGGTIAASNRPSGGARLDVKLPAPGKQND